MSIEQNDQSQLLLERLRTFANNEPEYLRLLHEVIEYWEVMNQSVQQQELIRQFQGIIIPEIVRIFNEKEPSMVDNTRHKIRRYSLEILITTPFPENKAQLPFDDILKLLMNVLKHDNEENAELALKLIIEMQRFYKTTWDVMEKHHHDFIRYVQTLYHNLPRKIDQVKHLDEGNMRGGQSDEQVLIPSEKSMKTIANCNYLLLQVNSLFEDIYRDHILAVVHTIYQAIDAFPESLLPEVRNIPLYIEFLDTMKTVLSFFTYIFKKNFMVEVISNLDKLIGVKFRIFKNTPQLGSQIRKDILNMIKFEITEIQNLEKADQAQNNNERKHLYDKKNQILQSHINDFLDISTMQGKGKLTRELQYYSRTVTITFISNFKEVMNELQLRKALQILIKNLLDSTVSWSLKNTLIYIIFRINEELQKKTQNKDGTLQLEIMETLIHMYKDLDLQLKIIVDELAVFKTEVMNLRKSSIKWMNDQEQKLANYKDLFFQEEYGYIDIDDDKDFDMEKVLSQYYFYSLFEPLQQQSAIQDITKIRQKYYSFVSFTDQQLTQYVEQQKEMCLKLIKNVNSLIEQLLISVQELKKSKFLKIHEMRLMRKLFIHGSRVFNSLYDMMASEKERLSDMLKRFAKIFQQMKTLQFRDLMQSVEDEFFGAVIECRALKKEPGIYYLADYLMSFQIPPPPGMPQQPYGVQKNLDDQAAYMLEIFFSYINKKMRIFNKAMEGETIMSTNALDQRLAKIPTPDLQDALQKLTLTIGEKALSKKGDQRMKNLFFSVFVFCIKYTKASQIVPYYFAVIRNLFKVLCHLSDSSNFMKEFIPMIQGLLETFLQAQEEASFIKETNEICYSVPAKLKNLIEYLPIISRPLIDSMKSNNIDLLESGINSIQMWVSALASYPEILDPVINGILPELNSLLYKILYLLPSYCFKLLGKLGAKSRLYNEDKEFKSKNYPEDGIKIDLIDRNSGKSIVLGIDSAIDVVLLKIFDSYHKYNAQKLTEAYKLAKNCFLCFIEPDVDVDYLVASIINARTKNTDLLTAYAMNATKYFDSKQPQIKISAHGKGSECHAFEKILKAFLIACSLPKNNPETVQVQKKVKKFFKWLSQYFTLIYICKNGKLKENLVDEISPIFFIENICDFLYYNMLQGLPKLQQRSFYKGSTIALKTMIRLVRQIYGEDDHDIYENLEFIQILIQKVCHLSYGSDLPKKVATNIALQILIKELPQKTIRCYWLIMVDSLFHILNTNNDSLGSQVEKECKATLDKIFEKIGLYSENIFTTIDDAEKDFFLTVIDKILQNMHQNKGSSRIVAIDFIELIARKANTSVYYIFHNIQCSYYAQMQQPNQSMEQMNQHQVQTWANFIITNQVESKARSLFSLFKGGYQQVTVLNAYLDILQFLLKHKIIEPFNKVSVYLALCEQLLKILEDEVEKYESKNDFLLSFNNDHLISSSAKAAVKYMKLEKTYISQNKPHDQYSHTLYPHMSMQNQHYEVEELAKRDKVQQEIEQVQYSFRIFEIFTDKYINPEQINQKAFDPMPQEDQQALKHHLALRINEFISKLFSGGIRASDVSFEYVHHMYELFPNHRLHCEMICKCLSVLADITTDDKMHVFLKERQSQFFEQQQQQQQYAQPQPNANVLNRKIDLYAVEIKSKVIAVYFKFFQREEMNIYKTAKRCLKRLLKKEINQQEALPNQILKECVRPSLNILSQKGQFPALYEQLTKLINLLHGCFNEQLGKHLIKCYEANKAKILEKIQLFLGPEGNENGESGFPPGGNPDSNMTQEQRIQDQQRMFNENYERLIIAQNQKIEFLEIANHIIKILYLLPTSRQDICKILLQLPEFELQVIQELENHFDETYASLLEHFQNAPITFHEQHIRPISIRLGILKSDYRQGLAKFYNKNPFESIEIFRTVNRFTPVMLDILKDPSSFCLRERVSREPENIKNLLSGPIDSQEFSAGIKMVSIFLKYNKGYLTLNHNYMLVDALRRAWNQLGIQNVDDLIAKPQSQSHIRKIYQKIMKCLLAYCRCPNAKIKILLDFIRGFRYQSYIDMTPVKLFFQYEVPSTFPLKKKRELLAITLEVIKFQPSLDEQKYLIFELGFMPSIIKHTISNRDTAFRELMDERLMKDFIETFFGMSLVQTSSGSHRIPMIETLRQSLEISQQVSYEQFQIEIIKVINLMYRYYEFNVIQAYCPQKEIIKITQFLYHCAKKAHSPILKEWAYYTLTSLFFKILDAQAYEKSKGLPSSIDEQMVQMIAQSSDQVLMMMLQHGPNASIKALVQKSFRNLISLLKDIRVKQYLPQNQSGEYLSLCLKRALIYEGRNTQNLMYLSSFILGNQEQFFLEHNNFLTRMQRIIMRFAVQMQPNLGQKQLLIELSAVLINWIQNRFQYQNRMGPITEEALAHYQGIFTNILFQLIRTSVMVQFSSNESIKEVLDLSKQCLKQIILLVRTFPAVRIQFPYFNRLLSNDGGDRENLQIIKLAILNVSYILIKYQRNSNDFKGFFLDFIVQSNTKHQKNILFTVKNLLLIIQSNQDPDHQAQITRKIRTFLASDLQKCLEENVMEILQKIKQNEDGYTQRNQPAQLAFQENAQLISNAIPHFTIRLISALESGLKDAGWASREITSIYTDNEFTFLRSLAQSIFKIVGYFRRHVLFDQNDMNPAKIRVKHNVVYQATNCNTEFTNPKDLISLQDDIVELKMEEPNYDLFNKESLMIGLLFIIKRIKKMKQEESIQILEIVQYTILALIKYINNEYLLEWLRKAVDALIEDDPEDISLLNNEQKFSFVIKMVQKIPALSAPEKRDNLPTAVLMERIFDQGVKFLEKMPSMHSEYTLKLFEQIFINLRGKPREMKCRVFQAFEKLNGSSIFKKLQYYFGKHQLEEEYKLAYYQSQSQLLEFTLHNFKVDVPLSKTKYSSKLFPLYNLNIKFQNQVSLDNPLHNQDSEYHRMTTALTGFTRTMRKYKDLTLKNLMNSLSELISINPSHSTDKLIADKFFVKLFWQYWNIMSREEQQVLSESINAYFIQTIPMFSVQEFKKNSLPKTFLEAIATLSPQIRLEPEVLQFLGKNLNLWHVTIPILENHITLYPDNERYVFSLNELYSKIAEEDYIAGLRRMVTNAPETRSVVSYAQHHMWEEINQQFSQFIIYYAEQEGLYAQMDKDYNIPGKYQRQLPHQIFLKLKENHKEQYKKMISEEDPNNVDVRVLEEAEKELDRKIEEASGQKEINERKQRDDGKSLFHKKFKEIDLRIWENLFIESLKVLNKWDQYRDIAHALQNQEMMIEYIWNIKDWRNLMAYEHILKKSESIKYQLYYIYLIIYMQKINDFDEMFKQVITLSYREWDQYLPNYIDSIQFENLIMFQLVMESSEGGRNMIKEAQNLKMRGRLVEIKTAINIWRERAPNKCESIQMWKEVLENRNFIQNQISHIISPVINSAQQGILTDEEFKQQKMQQEHQRQQAVNEFLDVAWNQYKLCQISRKQGFATLANYYWTLLKVSLSSSQDSEGMRYERFKCDYEELKINLQFNNNPTSLNFIVDNYSRVIKNRHLEQGAPQVYEPWQTAELCRLVGEYYLKVGDLKNSQFFLTRSIELNKKESKSWMSYAKLNSTVFDYKKSEVALQNTLKGYFNAVVLNLPKSRPIIPQIFKLIKRKDLNHQTFVPLVQFVKTNIEQMPAWIWIFWIPQILHLLYSHQNNIELRLALSVLDKLSKLYPQVLYHPLKMKSSLIQVEDAQQAQIIQNQVKTLIANIQRSAMSSMHYSDKISHELYKNMKSSAEEELYMVLTKILCMSQFFKIENFESDFQHFLKQINEKFMKDETMNQSQLISELKPIFLKDFIEESTKEQKIIEIIKRMKNLKDFLHKKLSLSEQRTHLEQISPYLANFNEKGVELPGQYMTMDTEPMPQSTIWIQRFDPMIYRSGITTKKLVIRGSNQKVYGFVISGIQAKDDYQKFCQEERVLQIKMLMNGIFARHKETLRRGIKFYVPIKVMMYRSKLSQDDHSFANLQEIHDYLFQERGFDSDMAFNLQVRKVEEYFQEIDESERTISKISAEKKKQINEETYSEMKAIYCQPYLLSSFFHRIFYNVDDLFIFKKQFTLYHAVNSYFQYIFSQVEFATLNQISFCKISGRVNQNEAKLVDFLKNRYIKQVSQQKHTDFDALEKEEINAIITAQSKTSPYMPFRLTSNIVDFMGRIGLNGLFAGAMTSCSIAMQKDYDKVIPLLNLVYRDEFPNDTRDQMLAFYNKCCDYIKFKMVSLSTNKNLIDFSGTQRQEDAASADQQEEVKNDLDDCINFGGFKVPKIFLRYEIEKPNIFEEFNKKVFDLIEIATDDSRLAAMPSNWNPWF